MDDREPTYLNPVYPDSFPDPFVLKYCGQYYAYATGHAPDGRVFEVLTSTDLVNWTSMGGAMEPLITGEPFYWAPEVTYYNGKFYLYYSVGNETFMTLRVAVSDRPEGGFVDAGVTLTSQQFAIDAHVFRDDDGSWWMFYATDFLEYSHIGTGTVVDRMIDMFTLAGDPRPVTRAKYDWQVYDPERKEKGGVRWHTVEGPFVLKRKQTYYEMFSGGNWQNVSYGVSFAVTKDLNDADEWQQFSDGEKTFPLIRTIPGKVLGPGHNSVIRGPNNRELYCVYHRWKNSERVLAIDRMDFAGGDRMFIAGPSYSHQPSPFSPSYFAAVPPAGKPIETGSSFYCEISARVGAGFQLDLLSETDEKVGRLELRTDALVWLPAEGQAHEVHLAAALDPGAVHEITMEIDRRSAAFRLNHSDAVIQTELPFAAGTILPIAGEAASIAVTRGFADPFEADNGEDRGWALSGEVRWDPAELLLTIIDGGVSRKVPDGDFELAVNMRVDASSTVSIDCGLECRISSSRLSFGDKQLELAPEVSMGIFRQLRFVRRTDEIALWLDGVGMTRSNTARKNDLRIAVEGGGIDLDMVRWTAI